MNAERTRYILTALLILLSLAICSCALLDPLAVRYPADGNGFRDSILWYSGIINSPEAKPGQQATAHLKLALILSHYRNPYQDYTQALRHVETYVDMTEGAENNDKVMNFLSTLRDMTGEQAGRGPAVLELKARNKALAEENAELRKTIGKLNDLEVELEKRRKQLR